MFARLPSTPSQFSVTISCVVLAVRFDGPTGVETEKLSMAKFWPLEVL